MDLRHLDEHGEVCTRHAPVPDGDLLALALVGSRAPSFHHDLASKLQGLMMAIDEIGEVAGDVPPPVMHAIETVENRRKQDQGFDGQVSALDEKLRKLNG